MVEYIVLIQSIIIEGMKTKHNQIYIIKWCLLLVLVVPIFSQNNSSSLSFADNLFTKGEYYRAITEYNRFLFYHSKTADDSLYAFQKIFKSYYYGKEYKNAISTITNTKSIFDQTKELSYSNKYLALSYFKSGFPKSAILVLNDNTNDPKSDLLSGISHLYLFEWDLALVKFASLTNHPLDEISVISKELISISKEGAATQSKKPVFSAIASALIPGSGYVYTENYQTGVSSFLINLLLLGSSFELHNNGFQFAGSTAMLVSFGWYAGNIYGSFTSAIKYNNLKRKQFLDGSCEKYIKFIEKD